MVYVNLEKAQADLIIFSQETEDEEAKKMFERNADKLKELMEKLKPYLLR